MTSAPTWVVDFLVSLAWAVESSKSEFGNPQMDLQDQGVIDSGCSRHMTGNMSYLTNYEEIDGGYVAFGGNLKGGKITRKVPRKNNMYSVDLKNIVSKGGLTCLFAKATSNESKLWHRRLGHLNFKTMNKLVKGNLVRGLPSKLFENDQTCVACQKGKQHRASCKSKTENSISLPLHLLHMDLFGPTFVKSLMKKMYCLVVTDDYSRFTWVFFLATKDETSGILKSFITGIENLVDHKVKVIRCDNGTEFKNREMNQFCEMKGILRQFSVARTPQQNGVAERRNRTLIEAARTMLADSKLPTTFWAEAVNTACYVQNRVLVVKPHNKTPYELFHGTQSNGFAGTKAYDNAGQARKETKPMGMDSNPLSDDGKKVDDDSRKDSEGIDQEKEDNVNSTNNVNAASTNEVNAVGRQTSIELPLDLNMPELEDYSIFKDDEDVGRTQKGNSCIEGSKLDRGYAGRASTIQVTRSLDFSGFTKWKKGYRHKIVYVDDIIFGSTKKELCNAFKKLMHVKFQMSSMRELTFFLGLQVRQKKDGIFISQDKYVDEILKKFGFKEVKTASTPIETQKPLLKDENGEELDVHMYRSMIGSLMYLTSSRPDIMFAVCACARYQVNSKVSHLHDVKRIFKYLKGQPKLGLWYPKDSPFDLVAYTDSDYAGASLDRKSTTGGCQFL
ncbi:putative ribonuclease H-like domain-containing protein [Tanacetum coccineum]